MPTPAVHDVRCPRCGAPLAWDGAATSVTCGYCQNVVPMRAAPQAVGTPHVATPKPGVSPGLWIALAGAGVLFIGGVAAVATLARGSGGTSGSVVAGTPRKATIPEVATIELATTPDQLAKRFGVTPRDNRVHIDLDDKRFASVNFSWDDAHLEHVSMVSLSPSETGVPPDVVERARAKLGRVLRPAASGGHQYNGEGVNLSIGGNVYVNAHRFDDPRWKERMVAMFTLLKGAALGTSDVLDERTKRDVLNLDYPLARLVEVDFDVPVEAAEREIRRVIPGAVSAAERHDVGLGHPWFVRATIHWENAARGKLEQINLGYAPTFDFKAQREDLERCLARTFGTPRVDTSNHLAGEVTLTFDSDPKAPWVHATNQLVLIRRPRTAVDEKAGVEKALRVLAACG